MSMTSTSFTIGLQGDGARNSSRVLRPPGGGHTDIFGGEPEPTRGRRQGYPQPQSSIGQGDEPKAKPNGVEAAPPAQNGALTPEQPAAPTPADAAPEPQHASPVQPEPKVASPAREAAAPAPAPAAAAAPAEPPKRVRVPPGGFSSGLW